MIGMYIILTVTVAASILGFTNKEVYRANVFSIESITRDRQFYRLFTSNFFHADVIHLLFNMTSFYFFAGPVEKTFGTQTLGIIYFGSALGGDIIALILQRRNPLYSAVGASGAVCGIIFASIFLVPGGSVIVFPLPIPIPAWLYAIIFILASLYGIRAQIDNIGHEFHLGGAIIGTAITGMLYPEALLSQRLLLIGVVFPVIIFFIVLTIRRRF